MTKTQLENVIKAILTNIRNYLNAFYVNAYLRSLVGSLYVLYYRIFYKRILAPKIVLSKKLKRRLRRVLAKRRAMQIEEEEEEEDIYLQALERSKKHIQFRTHAPLLALLHAEENNRVRPKGIRPK